MPKIKPFNAYRYNSKKIKKYDDVLTPPYDVISKEDQDKFYKKSPYNFVRIDLRKAEGARRSAVGGKRKKANLYVEAARELESWIQKKVLIQDDKPSLYVYVQDYKSLSGKMVTRYGFLTLMKINAQKVKKHENTLSGPKKDRTTLMEKSKSQLSPIMGLFQNKDGQVHKILKAISKKKAEFDIKSQGVRHRFYVEDNPKKILQIQQAIDTENMYIADGHHRFEVASRYKKENLQYKGAQYVLTYLCDADRNDFTIYPTHRVLNDLSSGWRKKYEAITKKYFVSKEHKTFASLEKAMEKMPKGKIAVGSYFDGKYYQLTLKVKTKDLDTTILDRYYIRKLLGEDVAGSKRYRYTRDVKEATGWVKKKEADITFFLSKMPIQEMIRVSDEGVKLPQKSTYFYPKLLSGMILYKFA